jgi:hypothetical protein
VEEWSRHRIEEAKKNKEVKDKEIIPHGRKSGTVENSSVTTNKPGTVSSLFR